MKYQGQVYDRLLGVTVYRSKYYPTWEAAHHAADKPRWSDGRYQIRVAEVSEESDQFEKIDCLCGKSFEKIDFGDVQCPYCGQIWGVA